MPTETSWSAEDSKSEQKKASGFNILHSNARETPSIGNEVRIDTKAPPTAQNPLFNNICMDNSLCGSSKSCSEPSQLNSDCKHGKDTNLSFPSSLCSFSSCAGLSFLKESMEPSRLGRDITNTYFQNPTAAEQNRGERANSSSPGAKSGIAALQNRLHRWKTDSTGFLQRDKRSRNNHETSPLPSSQGSGGVSLPSHSMFSTIALSRVPCSEKRENFANGSGGSFSAACASCTSSHFFPSFHQLEHAPSSNGQKGMRKEGEGTERSKTQKRRRVEGLILNRADNYPSYSPSFYPEHDEPIHQEILSNTHLPRPLSYQSLLSLPTSLKPSRLHRVCQAAPPVTIENKTLHGNGKEDIFNLDDDNVPPPNFLEPVSSSDDNSSIENLPEEEPLLLSSYSVPSPLQWDEILPSLLPNCVSDDQPGYLREQDSKPLENPERLIDWENSKYQKQQFTSSCFLFASPSYPLNFVENDAFAARWWS